MVRKFILFLISLHNLLIIKAKALFLMLGDKNVECPICGWSGVKFLPFGVKKRENSLCPNCFSLERYRMMYLFFKEEIDPTKKIKLLHFAPEKCLHDLFRSYKNIDYLSVDILPGAAMKVEDVNKLSFKNETFDLVCCSHILEHVIDDVGAMKEIKRVLKTTGSAFLQVPIADQENTFEDFSITSESERERIFGQKDHVRVYGRDYVKRLAKAGFRVEQIDFSKKIGPILARKYALLPRYGKGAPTEGIIFKCKVN